jgi:uncharacterized protein YdeI (YjbR/CyaY-like superfamily)
MHITMNSKVDAYVVQAGQWREVIEPLRTIALDCGLTEEFKWGKPCYSFEGTNIVVIQGFKAYCALLFMKGYLLSDPENVLIKTGENTKVGRQIRFATAEDVAGLEPVVKAYIREAIDSRTATGIYHLFFCPKTIPNPRDPDRKMYSADTQRQRFERLAFF